MLAICRKQGLRFHILLPSSSPTSFSRALRTCRLRQADAFLPTPTASVRLREYQEECIQSVLAHIKDDHKRLGISLATGSGKTVIFTQLIDRVHPPRQDATQSLIIAHRRELVEQAARHCINAYPSKSVDIEMGKMRASGFADITVASISSLISGDRMLKFDPTKFKMILVDEAHHIVASSYFQILKYFGLLNHPLQERVPLLVGVSATLSRFDGLRLSDAIDHIVYHKDYVDMIGEKWLSDVVFTTVESKANISKVKDSPTGDFALRDLADAVNTPETNEITFQAWKQRALSRRSTLIFCVDIRHVGEMGATFRRHGIDARFITSQTRKQVRGERLEAFKNNEYPVLINCGIFTEGTDIPNIDCVVLARPTKSRNLLIQMIGRGMRLSPGKVNCHVIDMVASLQVGVITTPTLFGLDPNAMIEEQNVENMRALKKEQEVEQKREKNAPNEHSDHTGGPGRRTVTFTDYDSVQDLIDDTAGERHIRMISQLAWVKVDEDRYVLSTQSGSYITIEKSTEGDESLFVVNFTQKISEGVRLTGNIKSPFMRPRQIGAANAFEDAVHAADTFATEKFPLMIIKHKQPWRRLPATEGQLSMINKTRLDNDHLTPSHITKGRAADMITKIKFGARGRFNRLSADKKREERATEKVRRQRELQQREFVRVGPTS